MKLSFLPHILGTHFLKVFFCFFFFSTAALPGALVIKNLPADAGDIRDAGSSPGLERSPGGGHGNPLWYPCLEHPTDMRAWWAIVHGVTKSQTWLKWLSTHRHFYHTKFQIRKFVFRNLTQKTSSFPIKSDLSKLFSFIWRLTFFFFAPPLV